MNRLGKEEKFSTSSFLKKFALRGLSAYGKLIHFGILRRYTSIYDIEGWDIAVILDACRYDLFNEVFDLSYIPDGAKVLSYGSISSAGTNSVPWMIKTFDVKRYGQQIADTIYVNANPNAEATIDQNAFYAVDNVWKYGWEPGIGIAGDSRGGTIQPRTVTDRAIYWFREEANKRLVIHYMQPHYPFIRKPLGFGLNKPDEVYRPDVWRLLGEGKLDRDEVWEAYRDNLELVLADLGLLIRCVEGKVLVSSDHGNLVGERGLYGHAVGWIPLKPLIEVPLLLIDAGVRDDSYSPQDYDIDTGSGEEVLEERLKALGYLS